VLPNDNLLSYDALSLGQYFPQLQGITAHPNDEVTMTLPNVKQLLADITEHPTLQAHNNHELKSAPCSFGTNVN